MFIKAIFLLERILPLVFWFLLMLGFDSPSVAILTVIAGVIHEGGHIAASLPFSEKRRSAPLANLAGFRIRMSGLSYKEELITSLGGPLINLAVGALCLLLPLGEYLYVFGILNIMTMLSNLLPIEGYDGYKAVSSAAALLELDPTRTERVLSALSFFFSAIVTFLSLYLILKIGEGYWIFGVFFTLTLSAITKRQKRAIYENN